MIRTVIKPDISQLVTLSEMKRLEYQTYAPTFWRNAADASSKQSPFFLSLLDHPGTICLAYERDKAIQGFIIASIVSAPPVYNPGTLVCSIDDFVVASNSLWDTVGRDLLRSAKATAKEHGAMLSVVVCGHLDQPKRAMLQSEGMYIASEWYVSP